MLTQINSSTRLAHVIESTISWTYMLTYGENRCRLKSSRFHNSAPMIRRSRQDKAVPAWVRSLDLNIDIGQ